MAVAATGRPARVRWRWGMALGVVALGATGALSPVRASAVDPGADLSVTVAHQPASAKTGDEITFTVEASNAGPDTATAAVAALGFRYPLELRVVPSGCRRSASYESVVCDLGDLASGASTSIDITLFARGSGLYSVPVAVASDTADPDASNSSATDTVLVKPGPTQAVRYITGIWPIIMERSVDSTSLAYWSARWKAANAVYPRKLEKVPAGIINSNEYRRLRIREAYQRILGRSVDPASLTYWVNKAAGGWSFEAIERTLLTSKEFANKHGDLEAIVRAQYQAILGRQPTGAEIASALSHGNTTPAATRLQNLQRSTEGYDVVIKRVFQKTVGHDPSPLSRYAALIKLRGGLSPEGLFALQLVSNEVLAKYPYTEDDYTEGPYYDPPAFAVPVAQVQAAAAAS